MNCLSVATRAASGILLMRPIKMRRLRSCVFSLRSARGRRSRTVGDGMEGRSRVTGILVSLIGFATAGRSDAMEILHDVVDARCWGRFVILRDRQPQTR